MKILITGSSGFIDFNQILHLSEKLDKLLVIDAFNDLIYSSIPKI
jgi:nucleoside-diphosphate-sugar epimerase